MTVVAKPKKRREVATRIALRYYLFLFMFVAALGWGLEWAGHRGWDVSINQSAFFHPTEDWVDHFAYGDLTDLAARTAHLSGPGLRKPGDVPFPYMPACALIVYALNHVTGHAAAVYLGLFAVAVLVALVLVIRRMGGRHMLAWPVLVLTALFGSAQIFCANRANVELFSCSLTAGGLALFLAGSPWAAAVMLGLAMSVKPFPALLLLLFLWRKQWAQAVAAVAVCGVVTVAALFVVGPTVPVAWHAITACWGDYFQQQVLVLNIMQELKTDHSLMDAVKLVIWQVSPGIDLQDEKLTAAYHGLSLWYRLDLWARFFQLVSVVAAGWVAVKFAKRPVMNQVFALVLLMLLLPYISSEYTLMILYLPCSVLLLWMSRDAWVATERQMVFAAVAFALLFAPLNVLGVFAGFVKCSLLLAVLCFVARLDLFSSLDRQVD